MFRIKVFLSLAAIILFLIPFFNTALPDATAPDEELELLVQSNNAFALDLYKNLVNNQSLQVSGKNLFFSPTGLSTCLAMTWAGARKETENQMASVLRLNRAQETTHRAFAGLTQDLECANALWVRKGLSLLPAYQSLIAEFYGAHARSLDFRQTTEAARETINAWIEENTDGRIGNLIEPGELDSKTELVLTNALYFNEGWASSFDPKNTRPRPFMLSTGLSIQVPTMYQRSRFGYAARDGISILKMPYAGKNRSMVVLLPMAYDGLPALENSLTAEKLSEWIEDLKEEKVGIFIPCFKTTSRLALENVLPAMGMPDAFSAERADFSGMTGWKGLFIDRVIHQAVVDVDEHGTEAAAGSAVTMKKGGIVFRADRPFLFLIRDDDTGGLLFMGRVVNPTL